MSKIISLLPRHYIGSAAEIAGITGVCGDTAYETDTDIYKHWCGAIWVTGGIPYYVERLTAAPDFQVGDLTVNGVWQVNGLDLSAIVPAGAFMVKLALTVLDDAANSIVTIRRDAVNTSNCIIGTTFVANISNPKVEDISIESDRLLDYHCSNLVFTAIDITVLGWWVQRCL
ncbi:hypothetical protein ES703_39618 [subsurface metagenome]